MDKPENNDMNLKRANYWSLSVCRLHDNTGIAFAYLKGYI